MFLNQLINLLNPEGKYFQEGPVLDENVEDIFRISSAISRMLQCYQDSTRSTISPEIHEKIPILINYYFSIFSEHYNSEMELNDMAYILTYGIMIIELFLSYKFATGNNEPLDLNMMNLIIVLINSGILFDDYYTKLIILLVQQLNPEIIGTLMNYRINQKLTEILNFSHPIYPAPIERLFNNPNFKSNNNI